MSVTIAETVQPIFIESYRLIYVSGSDKFKLSFDVNFLGLYEVLLFATLAIIIAYKITVNWIFGKLRDGIFQEKSIVFTMLAGCLGQGQFQAPRLISIVIVLILFTFFVYINYVMQSGFIISLLTTDPPVKFRTLSAVLRSGIQMYTSDYDVNLDVHGQLNFRSESSVPIFFYFIKMKFRIFSGNIEKKGLSSLREINTFLTQHDQEFVLIVTLDTAEEVAYQLQMTNRFYYFIRENYGNFCIFKSQFIRNQ